MIHQFRILSFNVWAIKYLSADRKERIKAITEFLSRCNYNIIALQELWTQEDFDTINESIKSSFPYSHYFDNGVIGSGIAIFTRDKITSASFHEFSANGYPHCILHGDWFAAKGLAFTRINVNGLNVHIYASHYHANYHPENDNYIGHRIIHSVESSHWIHLTSMAADVTIYAGDFNSEPGSVPNRILRELIPMKDCWEEVHGKSDSGHTNGNKYNSYSPNNCDAQRIDYIMYKTGKNIEATVESCTLPFPHRVPGKNYSYSDHEAVAAVINIERTLKDHDDIGNEPSCSELIKEANDIIFEESLRVSGDRRDYCGYALILAVMMVTSLIPNLVLPKYLIFISDDVHWFLPRIVVSLLFVFFLLMGTLFKSRELNALNSTKKSLQLLCDDDLKNKL